jgi:hypothetical protein
MRADATTRKAMAMKALLLERYGKVEPLAFADIARPVPTRISSKAA